MGAYTTPSLHEFHDFDEFLAFSVLHFDPGQFLALSYVSLSTWPSLATST